jgi:hypothetical protein
MGYASVKAIRFYTIEGVFMELQIRAQIEFP